MHSPQCSNLARALASESVALDMPPPVSAGSPSPKLAVNPPHPNLSSSVDEKFPTHRAISIRLDFAQR